MNRLLAAVLLAVTLAAIGGLSLGYLTGLSAAPKVCTDLKPAIKLVPADIGFSEAPREALL
jgi:hypothetical protein